MVNMSDEHMPYHPCPGELYYSLTYHRGIESITIQLIIVDPDQKLSPIYGFLMGVTLVSLSNLGFFEMSAMAFLHV